jgi:hypothetical protein
MFQVAAEGLGEASETALQPPLSTRFSVRFPVR